MENERHLNSGSIPISAEFNEVHNTAIPMQYELSDNARLASKEGSESEKSIKTQESAGDLSKELYIYRQDAVRCSKYKGMLGVVMEVAGDLDSDRSVTDDSHVEGDDEVDGGIGAGGNNGNKEDGSDRNISLSDGQVRVMWTDGSETTDNLSDMTVIDREFLHGDIVASVSDPTGQLGLVLDVNISVDLLSHTGELIKNVSSRGLKRVRDFTAGDHVVSGPWLGRVDDVLDNVTVLFDDGSLCKVMKADPLRLKTVSKSLLADAGFPYYPGQCVRAVSSSVFKTSRWLSGSWKANHFEGTVTRVQAGSVFVYWIASATGNSSAAVPAEEQNPKNLTLLSCFSHANWQLGDWCLLPHPQRPPSSSADETLTMQNFEGATEGFSSANDHSNKRGIEDKYNFCTESSGSRRHDPDVDLKDQQAPDLLNPSAANGNEGCEPRHMISTGTQDHIVSGGRSGKSFVMEKQNGTFPPDESSDSMNRDRLSNSGSGVSEASLIVLKSGSYSNSSSVSKEIAHESGPAYRKKFRKVIFKREKKAHRRETSFERALFIANIVSNIDVAWQDGMREFGVDSRSLIPINDPGDHEFFPEQYVVEKASNESGDSSEARRVGVVRSANAKERTVCVRWLKPVARPEDPREFDKELVVSSYEIDLHPDYDYCYGDLVVRLSLFSAFIGAATSENLVEEEQTNPTLEDDMASMKNSGSEAEQTLNGESDANFSDLSWVGHITGLQDGDIEVTWSDGLISKVCPQAVYVVGREDDGESFEGGSEVSDDATSWETVEKNEMTVLDAAKEEADLLLASDNNLVREISTAGSTDNNNHGQNGPLSISFAALGFVTRIATGLFSRGEKQTDLSSSDEKCINETGSQEILELPVRGLATDELSFQESDVLDDHSEQSASETAGECSPLGLTSVDEAKMIDDQDSHISNGMDCRSTREYNEDDSCSFKHFDITKDPLDHYFLGGSGQNTDGRKWVKKVQKEWSILEKNLPDAIYVRVFEDRMDLLRAVIIGACGTPYQDGLFFFDFHLPPEYPQVPPTAYYHSGGLRINPNLYEDGKVCLSLLNTWTGKGNEVWDSASSSILQVLVSLQGLVLNAKPYFNEAGYEKQVGTAAGQKNYLPYNENTFLLNLRSMLFLLRRPPMHFEEFIKDHFRRCGHYILKACDTYMKGCLVGSLTKDACMTDRSREHMCSVGFKLMLAKTAPKLFLALSEVGADCCQFEHLQKP